MTTPIKHLAGAAFIAAVSCLSCSSGTDVPINNVISQDAVVEVHDNAFVPNDVTIRAGHHVTWLWKSAGKHSLVFLGEVTPSQPAIDSTASVPIYDRAFAKPGIYYYDCGIPGAASGLSVSGMSGKITVTQ